MLDNIGYDDSDLPAIGLIPEGVPWEEIREHLKIARSPLLVPAVSDGQFVGTYWTEAEQVVTDDLGGDQEEALREFREILADEGLA
ncbi:MAG TPA: hypothetical protein VG253_03945 [Streptosporangiaceae bacterium]|nr:hypothetical protein [Streptosporangiaceae bacterium]